MSNLQTLLGLSSPPVAIAFRNEPPAGVARVDRPGPAGCAYWRRAAAGEVFYTTADDHKNCPVGAEFSRDVSDMNGVTGTRAALRTRRAVG